MSDLKFPLLDLKGLSEPITKLIETVGNAVGIVYEPMKIRRKAKAEADAAIILAHAKTEVQEIQVRAAERLLRREVRRQKNIEQITQMAAGALPQTVSSDPVDEDWVSRFFGHCQDVSNEQMQGLWAKLLAGEVARPGTFSARTLRVVADLHSEEADQFTNFCTFLWHRDDGMPIPVIREASGEYVRRAGLTFYSFIDLQSLGLIDFRTIGGFGIGSGDPFRISYYGKAYILTPPQGKNKVPVGVALLTIVGQQLAPIAGGTPSEDYRESVVVWWQEKHIKIEECQEGMANEHRETS